MHALTVLFNCSPSETCLTRVYMFSLREFGACSKLLCYLSKCRMFKFLIHWYYIHSIFSFVEPADSLCCVHVSLWVFFQVDISIIDHIFTIFYNVLVQKGLEALQWLGGSPEALTVDLLCPLMI